MKKLLLTCLLLLCFSCNNSIENKNLKNLSTPCEFLDVKMEIYKQISVFYDKYSDFDNYKEVEMVDFSKLMKLWQKNDEIDFQIGLNHWEENIKSCGNYEVIDSLQKKMNL
tara:strand:+ start:89 stop:421 length:333 start_codon:yes stop_codon:yes gene_type:complete